jgi:hypothetical protein
MGTLRGRVGALVVGGLLLAVFVGAPASAQQDPDDPYGSTSTTRRPPKTATIQITPTTGPSGTRVSVNACGYTPGTAGGSITFDGAVVATGLIAGSDGCLEAEGDQPRFTVPQSRRGTHRVCAVVAGSNTPCARFRITQSGGGNPPGSQVEGEQIARTADESGSLAGPGIAAALLLGLALLVGGRWGFEARSRRRREAERAALEASRRHRVNQ